MSGGTGAMLIAGKSAGAPTDATVGFPSQTAVQSRLIEKRSFSKMDLSCCLPGLAPAGDHLFFASPKKRWEKKGEPDSSALRAHCVARRSRGLAKLASLGQRQPLSGCTCATRLLITAEVRTAKAPTAGINHGRAMARPWFGLGNLSFGCLDFGGLDPLAVLAELSSAAAGGSGRALSERSEFSPTPTDASSARNRAAALTAARLSLAYFSLAKQRKVSRPPGRDPASNKLNSISKKPVSSRRPRAARRTAHLRRRAPNPT